MNNQNSDEIKLDKDIQVPSWVIREYGGMEAIQKGLYEWKALGNYTSKQIENYLMFEAAAFYKDRHNHFEHLDKKN